MLIDKRDKFEQACAVWRKAEWLALDTEFVREDTYFARLCLVQISDGRDSQCIDVLALGEAYKAPIGELLANTAIIKVLHSASQDLEVFAQSTGFCPTPLFDTQLAASLLGIGDQIGYAPLVETRLGRTLDKSLTRTNWARRPLSAAELSYAADDVRYLAELYPALRSELEAKGRLAWLEEDCARQSQPAKYATDSAESWRRLKGLPRLKPAEQAVAIALAVWRENQAIAVNRPRKWIIDDDVIYRLAERRPASFAQLENLRLLPPKTLERHGAALVAVIQANADSSESLPFFDAQLSEAQKDCVRRLLDIVRARAEELGVPPGVLAARADAEAIARNGEAAQSQSLRGWRRAEIGERLLAATAPPA